MTKLMNRLLRTISMLEYFINHSWEWSTNNTEMLLSELSPEDQRVSVALTPGTVHPGNSQLCESNNDGEFLSIQANDFKPDNVSTHRKQVQ